MPEEAETTEAEVEPKQKKPVLDKAAGRNLPLPTADVLRDFKHLGECTCINSRSRQLLQGALVSHAILRMRTVIRLDKQITEAEKRERWALRDSLKNAKSEEEEDLMALRVIADALGGMDRCKDGS